MVQVIELTEEEQFKIFMKMKKKKLAKMLIASNQLRQKLMDGKPVSFKFADSVFENMSKSTSISIPTI